MKKLQIILLVLLGSSFVELSEGQNPTYQQKLFYTCKVWGFVKYFHSNVSVCGVNWDSVLIADLPLVKSAVSKNDFNDVLDTILNAAGPMALTNSPPSDTMAPELKRNLNFTWLNDPIFRADVQTQLDTIKNNFRPHAECWVHNNLHTNSYDGWLVFPNDSLILNINDYTNYPDEWHRLLELFVHWNIINYFNPYNYIQNQPWDSSLTQNILSIDSASNDKVFFTAFRKLISNMDDEHIDGATYDTYCYLPVSGYYSPNIVLRYISGKYLVVKSGISGLTNGDEIISINGLTTKQWEDSLKPYISVGDSAAFHNLMEAYMIEKAYTDPMNITYYDSVNNIHSISKPCIYYEPYLNYYPNDSLANVQWKYWGDCNIGYINAGKMQDVGSDVSDMYTVLKNTNAIIFDIRNYPASNAIFDLIDNYLAPVGSSSNVKFMTPDVTYPGTYYWKYQSAFPGSSNPYNGKIIVLFNEVSESEAEYASMILGELPNSIKIGSQTDGTDGNVTYYRLSDEMYTGFTTLGVFYPNGDSTERVGIIPDSLVYQTQAGIRAGKDEMLEKALQVAGCITSVPSINSSKTEIIVHPNPCNGKFTISCHLSLKEPIQPVIKIYNEMGGQLLTKKLIPDGDNIINISNQPSGIYFYRIINDNGGVLWEGKIVNE